MQKWVIVSILLVLLGVGTVVAFSLGITSRVISITGQPVVGASFSVGADQDSPAWFNQTQNATEVPVSGYVIFLVNWSDNSGLSTFIFSTNDTGEWVNESAVPMRGTENLSNTSYQVGGSVGDVASWRVYANDTSGNWNVTDDQNYTILEGADDQPPAYTAISQNSIELRQEEILTILVNWTDNTGLSTYIFSTDETGEWVNFSAVAMEGSDNLSNYSYEIRGEEGKFGYWRVYANDTSNNWNESTLSNFTVQQSSQSGAGDSKSKDPSKEKTKTDEKKEDKDSDKKKKDDKKDTKKDSKKDGKIKDSTSFEFARDSDEDDDDGSPVGQAYFFQEKSVSRSLDSQFGEWAKNQKKNGKSEEEVTVILKEFEAKANVVLQQANVIIESLPKEIQDETDVINPISANAFGLEVLESEDVSTVIGRVDLVTPDLLQDISTANAKVNAIVVPGYSSIIKKVDVNDFFAKDVFSNYVVIEDKKPEQIRDISFEEVFAAKPLVNAKTFEFTTRELCCQGGSIANTEIVGGVVSSLTGYIAEEIEVDPVWYVWKCPVLEDDGSCSTEWIKVSPIEPGLRPIAVEVDTSDGVYGIGPPPDQAVCGDTICSVGETCSGCAQDCGVCEIYEPGECQENWTCSVWDDWDEYRQHTRNCVENNGCGTEKYKPKEQEFCPLARPGQSLSEIFMRFFRSEGIIVVSLISVLAGIYFGFLNRVPSRAPRTRNRKRR